MATTRLMPLHIGKGQTAGDAIKRALGYIKDPMKTENGILVTSYGCTPQGTVKYYAQIHLQVWQNSVCTGQGNLPLIT